MKRGTGMKVDFYEYDELGYAVDPESDTKEITVILVGKQTVKANPRPAVIYVTGGAINESYEKLEELKNSGKTIVIVTHSLDVVKKLCHRAIWIYKGEVRLDGDPVYVIDEYLDQVAKDHKEERKKAIESGKGKGRAGKERSGESC